MLPPSSSSQKQFLNENSAPLTDNHANPTIVTQENFMAEVVEASQKTLILASFQAESSAPSKQLTPLLANIAKSTAGSLRLVTIDAESNTTLIAQLIQLGLPLQSLPLVVAFWQGQVLDLFQGAKPQNFVQKFVETLLRKTGQPLPSATLLEDAAQALTQGQAAQAASLYSEILENDAENPSAWAGLLRSMIELDDVDSAEEIAAQIPPALVHHHAVKAARTALSLAQEGQKAASDLEELRQNYAKNSQDSAIALRLALALNGAGQREEAAEILLTLIRSPALVAAHSEARATLLRFFEGWGVADPLTIKIRRILSSLLFS